MSDSFPKEFKIIALQEENLPKHVLKDVILHCSTIKNFETILNENDSSILTLVCTNDTLIDIAPLLSNKRNIDTIYVCTDQRDIMWPYELENINFKWTKISNQEQMMRHLCTKAMVSYFEQGKEYKKNGDYGLANLCFIAAKKACDQLANC